ncbi:MAG: SPFH domain-containing protein [Devosia sp.]
MNRLIAIGVVALVAIYLLFSSIYIVNVREQAIVLRFGQITEVRKEPGLYFKLPTNFVDTVQIIENRLLRYDIANMQLQVSDGAKYIVDAFLTYRIADATKFRQRLQGDLDLAEQRIGTRFDAALRQVYGRRLFTAALSAERPEMMREAGDLIRPGMSDLGIDIVDVRILRTDLLPDVSKNTFDRMSAERFAQAAAIRADGQQASQSLKAIADRQAVEIVAAASKDSEIIRGEGDGNRAAIFASAYGADPEFFEFYRSLESYRTALGGVGGTSMVLSPDSEFFRYFKSDTSNGTVPTPAAPNGIPPLPLTEPDVPAPTDTLPLTDTVVPEIAAPTLDQATPAITTTPADAPPAVNPDGSVVAPVVPVTPEASSAPAQ